MTQKLVRFMKAVFVFCQKKAQHLKHFLSEQIVVQNDSKVRSKRMLDSKAEKLFCLRGALE